MSPIHRADINTGREAISPSTIRKSARSFSRRSSSTRPFCAGFVARLFLHPRVALRYRPSHKPRPIVASYLMPHRSMRASEIGSMLPRRSEEEGLPSQSLPPECILVAYPRTLHVPVFAQAEIRLEVLKNVVVSDSSVSPRKYRKPHLPGGGANNKQCSAARPREPASFAQKIVGAIRCQCRRPQAWMRRPRLR